ncbi:TPA: hypothetical protein ACH3X1_002625 [Trebouxia sp. C0004]
MLEKFLSVTYAITLPDLEEYNWRSNKEALYDVFQKYYEQDPSTHVAPIPTAQIELPVERKFHRHVCYSQHYMGTVIIPERQVRDTAAAILSAAIKLDNNTDATAIQQHNPDIGNGTLRKYVLKRNHSGFARKVVQITLNLTNWQSGTYYSALHSDHSASIVGQPKHPNLSNMPDSIVSHKSCNVLHQQASGATSQAASQPSLELANAAPAAPADLASSAPHASVMDATAAKPSAGNPLQDAQQLLAAAERMLKESCGEDWLLQPFIPDMGSNEYRVNLIGGSQAKGSPSDAAVVFTPAKAADNQLYMYNLTLPHGFFSRAPIGATDLFKSEEEYRDQYFPYPAWKEPAMHRMLVDVALEGAQAFLQSERPSSMSQHVLLRIDIALTQLGNMVRPFINEAHYYADATIMFPVWPPEQQSVHTRNQSDTSPLSEGSTQPRTVTGWGLWLAQALWKEVQLRCAQCDSPPDSLHGPLPIFAHSLDDIEP